MFNRNSLLWKLTLSNFIVIVLVVIFLISILWIVVQDSGRLSRQLTIENAIQTRLIYNENGSVDYHQILEDAEIRIFCEEPLDLWGFRTTLKTKPEEIEVCDSDNRILLVPTIGYLSNGYQGLQTVAIYDQNGEFVTGFPDREPDRSTGFTLVLGWALNSLGSSNLEVSADAYRQSALDNRTAGVSSFAVPLYDSIKEDEIGAIIFQFDVNTMNPIVALPITLLIILAGGGIGMLGSYLIARQVNRRVVDLQAAAASWGQGDFSVKVDDHSNDEIGRLGRDLNQMSDQLEELVETRSMLVGVETRQELARDLHDAAKQQLFAAGLQLEAVAAMLDSQPEKARTHLASASTLTDQAQEELASVIQALRPVQLQEKGLFEATKEWIVRFEKQEGISANVDIKGKHALPPEVETAFFRILQEALSNVAKHSQASQVDVTLSRLDGRLALTIKDNGLGFDPDHTPDGFGLHSMQQRIERLGGQMTLSSQPEAGTELAFILKIA